ncbi:4-hydroxythreonine-4-phosphate dehydrogenase PdxA [Pelosinus sp. sgz500959]|uniref:4-hydroxythreonine-4-phosphate dehydrogenase PdxA n=1 Tax=Pelosinus sp. sgz500959 TaxID=3242472 RepID=UPI00367113D6
MKPILGITMGDGAGVGPEIIIKALSDQGMYDICRPLVIGDKKMMERANAIINSGCRCRVVSHPREASGEFGIIDIIDLDNLPADLTFGQVNPQAGKAAFEYIEKAAEYALKNEIQAIITAPINKEAVNLAGYHYPGHTEILAHFAQEKNYSMLLYSKNLSVIHVSTHVALRDACDMVKKDRIERVVALADDTMKLIGLEKPRIAVAGLNPHCGENGMFGKEDLLEIVPAVEECSRLGFCVQGPIAPDTVFYRAAIKNDFDVVVVMYHDQGHIPLKLLDFHNGVNVTVGLPFIRTSVDHGTAFDIAGHGIAEGQSMKEAIKLGAQMAKVKFAKL